MFTGERKKEYQREYMRRYRSNGKGLTETPAGLTKGVGLTEKVVRHQKMKDVFIGGRRFSVPDNG